MAKRKSGSAIIYLRKTDARKADGKAPVLLRVRLAGGERFPVYLDEWVSPDAWDPVARRVSKRAEDWEDVNMVIESSLGRAADIFRRNRLRQFDDPLLELTRESFENEFLYESSRQDFIEYMRRKAQGRYQSKGSDSIGAETYKHVKVTVRKLLKFTNQKPLPFSRLSDRLIERLEDFHARHYEGPSAGKQGGKMGRYTMLRDIRTYLRLAEKEGIAFKMPRMEMVVPEAEIVALTASELGRLLQFWRSLEWNSTKKFHALRMFLFDCFVGPHLKDCLSLTWEENVFEDEIRYRRGKTDFWARIPLLPVTRELLGEPGKGRLFPEIRGQYISRVLSWAAEQAHIDLNFSFQNGRDTFATLFYEHSGGDLYALKEMLGHQNIQSTLKYVRVRPGHKKKQMKKFLVALAAESGVDFG